MFLATTALPFRVVIGADWCVVDLAHPEATILCVFVRMPGLWSGRVDTQPPMLRSWLFKLIHRYVLTVITSHFVHKSFSSACVGGCTISEIELTSRWLRLEDSTALRTSSFGIQCVRRMCNLDFFVQKKRTSNLVVQATSCWWTLLPWQSRRDREDDSCRLCFPAQQCCLERWKHLVRLDTENSMHRWVCRVVEEGLGLSSQSCQQSYQTVTEVFSEG